MGYDINPFIEFDERWGPRRELMTSNMAILYGTRDQLLFGLLSNGSVGARSAGGFAPKARGLPERTSLTLRGELLYGIEDERGPRRNYISQVEADDWIRFGGAQWCLNDWRKQLEFYDPAIHGALGDDGCPRRPEDGQRWDITRPCIYNTSWLTADELEVLVDVYAEVGARIWDGKEQQPFMGVDGTPLPLVFKAEPGKIYRPHAEVNAWLAALRALEGLEQVERARLVFWFCN